MRVAPLSSLVAALQLLLATATLVAQVPTPPRAALTIPMPGIETFHPVTTTVAIGSNAAPDAMPALERAGFEVVIAIREDGEEGFDRPAVERAASNAGLRFVSIPFNRAHPDPSAVRRFLEVIAAPENRYAYVYCHSGARASTMWLIKRVQQDGWTLERAMAEAESLGLSRPELKQFATEFLASPVR